jgi:hypothetical protein
MVKKHGSWLSAPSPLARTARKVLSCEQEGAGVGVRNVQELEWSALARQALRERVGDVLALTAVAQRWVTDRRARAVRIDWQFRSVDAAVKLKRLYPVFSV